MKGAVATGLMVAMCVTVLSAPVPVLAYAEEGPSGAPVAGWPPLGSAPAVEYGARGTWVLRLQWALSDAVFRPGLADGEFGPHTLQAVLAYEKLYDLERDGIFEPVDWARLAEPVLPPGPAAESDRIEIDLRRQVLYLIEQETVAAVLPVSTGNGAPFTSSTGRTALAVTPEGAFTLARHIDGWRESYLGKLYRPFYFRGGYAIHGSTSVPAGPASHGCVRVTIDDMDFLVEHVWLGMPVFVYGRSKERSDVLPSAGASLGEAARSAAAAGMPVATDLE